MSRESHRKAPPNRNSFQCTCMLWYSMSHHQTHSHPIPQHDPNHMTIEHSPLYVRKLKYWLMIPGSLIHFTPSTSRIIITTTMVIVSSFSLTQFFFIHRHIHNHGQVSFGTMVVVIMKRRETWSFTTGKKERSYFCEFRSSIGCTFGDLRQSYPTDAHVPMHGVV